MHFRSRKKKNKRTTKKIKAFNLEMYTSVKAFHFYDVFMLKSSLFIWKCANSSSSLFNKVN